MSELTHKLNARVQEKFQSVLERAGLGGMVVLLGEGSYSWATQFPQWTGLMTKPDGSLAFDSDDLAKLRRAVQVLEVLCRATHELNDVYTGLLYQVRRQLAQQGLRVVPKDG